MRQAKMAGGCGRPWLVSVVDSSGMSEVSNLIFHDADRRTGFEENCDCGGRRQK
jgi:hypothetical protein